MAGKKDYSVVSVTTGLTKKQAADLVGKIAKAKNDVAPLGRGTAAMTSSNDGIRKLFQRSFKQLSDK